ncbi:fimbrial biogenesis chaperone [Ramlibacter sp.]|uniref:fimbrial biogenesis chaperone n=1 Tax=Ramlibacter sp. TaxID=1917967 RepID=UPI003D102054
MKFAWLAFAAATLLPAWTAPAAAGTFSVTPVRIYMGPRDRAVAMTVTNEGDTELVLQADLSAWTQSPDGVDQLVPTEDLILAPPIVKLAPKARQVVRLALLAPADASRQLIYRMVVREVPEIGAVRAGIQVPIALALSMPVFVTPPVARRQMSCDVVRSGPTTLDAMCRNTGTAYAQVREAALKRDAQVLATFEGGTYILPGARRGSPMKSTAPIAPGRAQLQVDYDDGKTDLFDITVP